MSRSGLMRSLRRSMRAAQLANARGWSDQQTEELAGQALEARISRRALLGGSGAAALAAGLPFDFGAAQAKSLAKRGGEPVIIIGAGAAGLAAAYQLTKARVPFHIYDAATRFGGRIYTERNVNADGHFVERGAELVDTNNYTLRGLAAELGLVIEDFRPGDKGFMADVFCFDGKIRGHGDFISKLRPLLARIEKANKEIYEPGGKAVDEYINAKTVAAMPAIKTYDAMTIDSFLDSVKGDTDGWVMEAIRIAYLCEFGMETSEQSAINLIDVIDTDLGEADHPEFDFFGPSDEAWRVRGGNQGLTDALVAKLGLSVDDSRVSLNSSLIRIGQHTDGRVKCFFRSGETVKAVAARHVICTVPFKVLREVEGLSTRALAPMLDARDPVIRCINEMGYGNNTKLMMDFKSRFWRQDTRRVQKNTGTLYSDLTSQTYWETSRLQGGTHGILTNFTGGNRAVEVAKAGKASRGQAIADLGKVYADASTQHTGTYVLQPWPIVPTVKGSYSSPSAGQYSSIWGYNYTEMDNSLFGGRLIFAGEHAHPLSWGFMNGAYNSGFRAANLVLEQLKKKTAPIPGRALLAEDDTYADN